MNPPTIESCQVVELRQYTLVPGQRETLIELFDRYFVDGQEDAGMRVIGQFRDLADPDRFVWLRGFADMDGRADGLQRFYFGPVWTAHRSAANVTMIDSDNVLLLRPAWEGSALRSASRQRAAEYSPASPGRRVFASVFHLKEAASSDLLSLAKTQLTEALRGYRASEVGWYATLAAENNFPRLPVREGEHVLVAVAVIEDAASIGRLQRDDPWCALAPMIGGALAKPTQTMLLQPTARSLL
jgi:hypothetical protein